MKKRLLICLILSICCIISSIPASAVTDDNECIEHGPFVYWCRTLGYTRVESCDYIIYSPENPEVMIDRCSYTSMSYETRKICEFCLDEVIIDSPHGHGEYGHRMLFELLIELT